MSGSQLSLIPPFPSTAPAAVRAAKEASLQVKGGRLFNSLPKELRDMSSSVDAFKAALDGWLATIPDEPTVSGRQRTARTNSLIDQVANMPPV